MPTPAPVAAQPPAREEVVDEADLEIDEDDFGFDDPAPAFSSPPAPVRASPAPAPVQNNMVWVSGPGAEGRVCGYMYVCVCIYELPHMPTQAEDDLLGFGDEDTFGGAAAGESKADDFDVCRAQDETFHKRNNEGS